MKWAARTFSLAVAVLLTFCSFANGSIVFDWPNNGWTQGTPTAGQTLNQNFTSVTPNDINVAVNNSGSSAQGANFAANYPQLSANPLTGGLTGVSALQLDLTGSSVASAYVKVTVTFASAVTNLSFQLWDVDAIAGLYVDKISNIQALAQGGGTVGPDSVTHPGAGYNTITGTGLSTVVLGTASATNSTNQGTIDIAFNGPITQFTFTWSNNDPALGTQYIALGPLTYSPVPEMATAWSTAGACGVIVTLELARRHRRRRQSDRVT